VKSKKTKQPEVTETPTEERLLSNLVKLMGIRSEKLRGQKNLNVPAETDTPREPPKAQPTRKLPKYETPVQKKDARKLVDSIMKRTADFTKKISTREKPQKLNSSIISSDSSEPYRKTGSNRNIGGGKKDPSKDPKSMFKIQAKGFEVQVDDSTPALKKGVKRVINLKKIAPLWGDPENSGSPIRESVPVDTSTLENISEEISTVKSNSHDYPKRRDTDHARFSSLSSVTDIGGSDQIQLSPYAASMKTVTLENRLGVPSRKPKNLEDRGTQTRQRDFTSLGAGEKIGRVRSPSRKAMNLSLVDIDCQNNNFGQFTNKKIAHYDPSITDAEKSDVAKHIKARGKSYGGHEAVTGISVTVTQNKDLEFVTGIVEKIWNYGKLIENS
jgi:hypothetical protein